MQRIVALVPALMCGMLLSAQEPVQCSGATFTVAAVNCGQFNYDAEDVSEATYGTNWVSLAQQHAADVFFYEDVGRAERLTAAEGCPDLDILVVRKTPDGELSVVELPRTISVGGREQRTRRYRALRLVRTIAGRRIAFYGIHLVAEGHIVALRPTDGSLTCAQRLRRRQFEALMADARQFDEAVIAGDFNAQIPLEYAPFEEAGYAIGNCSARFGAYRTLRNLPADNIVVSPGLELRRFEVLRDLALDTDHLPVRAKIGFARKRREPLVLETARWQAQIDATAAAGGGRVVIPSGEHPVGQLDLKSNVELHLEKGAVLEGAAGLVHYRVTALPYSEGTWSAVVSAIGVTNVAVTGQGTVNGRGERWSMDVWCPPDVCKEGLRPRGLFFGDCRDVRLEGFTLRDSACWGIVFKRCNGVTARHVTIDSHAHRNNDGFDVEAANVLIEDCDVDAGDDAVCIKSNDPDFTVENVRVIGCTARSHCNGFKIGTASHGTIRNVRFERCQTEAPRRDFPSRTPGFEGQPAYAMRILPGFPNGTGSGALCVENVDGGTVEDIAFEDVTVDGFATPIFIRGGVRTGRRCGTPPGDRRVLRNIRLSRIRGRALRPTPCTITGVDLCPVRDVSLSDVAIECVGDGLAEGVAVAEPDETYDGRYPDAFMFWETRLPAHGLYVDRAFGVTLTNVVFTLRKGTSDVRPSVFFSKRARQDRRNPLDFPSYEQTIEAAFATPADAEAARLSMAGLPDNAPVSFGSRWDDSTPAHLEKAAMLARTGIHATFFLIGNENYLVSTAPKLRAFGHSVGNHMLTHPCVLAPNANLLFREVLENRVLEECALNQTVVSFVAPFGWSEAFDSDRLPLLRRTLLNTGHFAGSDRPPEQAAVDPREFFFTNIFAADDTHPSEEKFWTNISNALVRVHACPSVPRITFGIHSWCSSADVLRQEEWLRRVKAGHPDWHFGNDNEYAAYRYGYENARIVREPASGRTVRYRVTRYDPAFLGANIAASLVFSVQPASVRLVGGDELARTKRGTWTLPHAADRAKPLRICRCDAVTGIATNKTDATFAFRVFAKEDAAEVVVRNTSGSPLHDVTVCLYLPPGFAEGRQVLALGDLERGASVSRKVPFGRRATRPDYSNGDAWFAASVDFLAPDCHGRLWATCERMEKGRPAVNANRVAVGVGPLPAPLLSEAACKSLSRPGNGLANLEASPFGRWRPSGDRLGAPDVIWTAQPFDRKGTPSWKTWTAAYQALADRKCRRNAAVVDFASDLPRRGCVRFWTRLEGTNVCLCANGKVLAPRADGRFDMTIRAGTNRLVVSWQPQANVASMAKMDLTDGAGTPLDVRWVRPDVVQEAVDVPDLLTTASGEKVTTREQWESVRRPELKRLFEEQEYGVRPVGRPERLSFETIVDKPVWHGGRAHLKRVKIGWPGTYESGNFVATAFIPRGVSRPVPVFVLILHQSAAAAANANRMPHDGQVAFAHADELWPVDDILARGFATVAFVSTDVADDDEDGFAGGVYPCFEKPSARTASSWASISAWGWGASRVLDWIETEPLLDASKVAVVGLSRAGKAALWAAAEDERFAMACSAGSGTCGVKLNHLSFETGESVQRILRHRHFFCRNFDAYAGHDADMPFDQHEMIALIAPRLVCIASGSLDTGATPVGEYFGALLASPAWNLYGLDGLVSEDFPAPEVPRQAGSVSYHVRTGGHDLTSYDWARFMDFAQSKGW